MVPPYEVEPKSEFFDAVVDLYDATLSVHQFIDNTDQAFII